MALSRRTGQRFQGSVWPGFVDAMTGLLMVLTFVLTIFMVIQFVLRETISGQEDELTTLADEVAALAGALGLEERENSRLQARLGALNTTLSQAEDDLAQAQSLIASLTTERDRQAAALDQAQTRITDFEAQVAALLAEQEQALGNIAALETQREQLLSEQEALNLALAQSREEIDAQTEAARLAAARREALEALVADLEQSGEERAAQITTLEQQLSDEEAARLAEAAAAEALRNRLQDADAELTAMTLALEAQRQEAEDTLTLLAAAQAAQAELQRRFGDLDPDALKAQLEAALQAQTQAQADADEQRTLAEQRQALLALAESTLSDEKEISAEAQREAALLNQQIAALRGQLGSLQALLDDFEERNEAAEIQIQTLGQDLNAALARAASEERRRRLLEEAERLRLEAEAEALAGQNEELAAQAEDLQRYRSEFFGRLRDVLGDQEGVRIEGDRFVFSSEVLFPTGSAVLSTEGRLEVAKVANILRSVAAEIPTGLNWVIRVDGHTDNVPLAGSGRYRDNWELSQGRALSVVRYMVDALGIPPNRLAANGFGEFQPVNPADTPEARAQNRRIELKLTER
ncbi:MULTISPECIES: peptidoglycan -binding protein [unclassified Ruegeria]|uniref:peptidoglycan -binding protein n=1 Tax=unclassified Ruegeria TaxID=2625375 RepID=UPI0014880401|nr:MULTISPECIES: peptidoglycan -binding protein [unclassified Ruegeria]NOD89001.1 peptidoglycan -binding protein [Ruegeria sp. HKCCD4318]NOE14413.1 peptidoglycan -binding protein [Ruegeria sp. HKCCD4318-2]NOG10066.1 peptidoglycan -binding protein [Ruegeria sp. HKCCD4315]